MRQEDHAGQAKTSNRDTQHQPYIRPLANGVGLDHHVRSPQMKRLHGRHCMASIPGGLFTVSDYEALRLRIRRYSARFKMTRHCKL